MPSNEEATTRNPLTPEQITQLVREVSHDANNQLALIRMTVELLQRKVAGTEHERAIDQIERSTLKCIETLRGLDVLKVK